MRQNNGGHRQHTSLKNSRTFKSVSRTEKPIVSQQILYVVYSSLHGLKNIRFMSY